MNRNICHSTGGALYYRFMKSCCTEHNTTVAEITYTCDCYFWLLKYCTSCQDQESLNQDLNNLDVCIGRLLFLI